jgi:E3 ubiquitin-protein ligase HECTD2
VIIERCVNTYLRSRLEEPDAPPRPPTRSPPPSPLFAEPGEIPEGLLHIQSHEQDHPVGPPPSEPLSTPPHPIPNPRSSSLLKATNERVSQGNGESVTSASLLDFPRRPIEQLGRRGSSPMLEVPEREDTMGLLNRRQDSDAGRKSFVNSSFSLFRSLENYVISSFNGSDCVNQSFLVARPTHPPRAASEGVQPKPILRNDHAPSSTVDTDVFEIDAKTLLAGDVAENGFWITGGRIERNSSNNGSKGDVSSNGRSGRDLVNMKTPRINWQELVEWYHLILHAGDDWVENWLELRPPDNGGEENARLAAKWDSISTQDLEQEISEGRMHAQRTLLKATENLLKRPRRPLKHPEEARFLLILLANPLLYVPGAPRHRPSTSLQAPRSRSREPPQPNQQNGEVTPSTRQVSTSGSRNTNTRTSGPGHHSGIVKRILGLLSNLPNECHHYLISWFSRFSDPHFQRTVDLIGSFVTYRLSRQHNRKRSEAHFTAADLISSSVPGAGSNAQLHHALGASVSSKSTKSDHKIVLYGEDWQIKAAARVMSLFFSANNNNPGRKRDTISPDLRFSSAGLNARHQAHVHGQILPISTFYNTLLDYSDLVADFEAWETHRGKFSFCQYPFFLSIWAKIHILEHDARRQMEVRAREAFFDSILSRKAVSQYLVLKVRRECLVDDSLRGVSEVVGAGQEEIKKGLRIEFVGEEGVDAGGLRKEWFLLLVREVFDPDHGK